MAEKALIGTTPHVAGAASEPNKTSRPLNDSADIEKTTEQLVLNKFGCSFRIRSKSTEQLVLKLGCLL
jgi:hypothetical protein